MRNRRGFTLMEMLVYMMIVSILTTFLMKLMIQAMRLSRHHVATVALTTKTCYVTNMLRNDVRNARSLSARRDALQIERPDGKTVRYEVIDGSLRRNIVHDAVEIKGGFRAACRFAAWEVSPSGRTVRMELELTADGLGKVGSSAPIVIVASKLTGVAP